MSNLKKKLGVIGGLGPAATSFYYDSVINHTKASCDQEHIDMYILSHATTPDRTQAIISGDTKELIDSLVHDIKILEQLGVSNIAIPCNTSHYFYEEMQRSTSVPIIHMIRESVLAAIASKNNVGKIGIMGTDGTIQSGIYDKECRALGIEPVHPSTPRQKDVMHIIYNEIKCGKSGSEELFQRIIDEFAAKGCDVVILACTELSVYRQNHQVPHICLDAMDVLVKESILRSNAEYKI